MKTRGNRIASYGCLMLMGLGAIALQSAARAQPIPVVYTDWGRLERVTSAWRDDAMGVYHSAPFLNSGELAVLPNRGSIVRPCGTVNDGYATDPTDPGHKLHHAIILGAFLHAKQVRLLIQGCSYSKPRII